LKPFPPFSTSKLREWRNLSLERIIIALVNLGLTRMDAEVYVYLAKKGSMKAIPLASALNYTKNQIYSSLRRLTTKELVIKNGKLFLSIPFEEALELLIERGKKQANHIQKSRKELLANWRTRDKH
jgi:sugar-specific transcriptional regulator TrmB